MTESTEPTFEEVFPDFETAGALLAAAIRDDYEAVDRIQAQAGVDWWNVSWTLALIVKGLRSKDPATLSLLDGLTGEPDLEA